MGEAVKIIDVDDTGENFFLLKKVLLEIFEKVPEDMPVAIVGVVGAFRTGKSFLLDFFLRYLKNTDGKALDSNLEIEDKELTWMSNGGLLEGGGSQGKGGFKWSPGRNRCTTGIWIWNEPFVRIDPATKKEMAVFLMDTQGMHDHKTGTHLTASIFGLSSLLSSYMVFNLSKQIQEDHIQQLALFSEYGRMATEESKDNNVDNIQAKAFQKLDFLVRDYPHFGIDVETAELEAIREEMGSYLDEAMSHRSQADLKEVRDQIDVCYEEVGCYCLPNPGFAVTEASSMFKGEVQKIRPVFIRLVGDYIRRVFNERVCVKRIQGGEVTALKLFEYVEVYCRLFQDSSIVPHAKTLLRETQEASIRFATKKAIKLYNEKMMAAGISKYYLEEKEIKDADQAAVENALSCFTQNNRSGTKEMIQQAEQDLQKEFSIMFRNFHQINALKGAEEKNNMTIVIENALQKYNKAMTDVGVTFRYFETADFEQTHEKAIKASVEYLKKTAKGKKVFKKAKTQFDSKMKELLGNFKTTNALRGKEETEGIESAIREALHIYNLEMDSVGIGESQMTEDDVRNHHTEAVKEALSFYDQKDMKGYPMKIEKGRLRLGKRLSIAIKKYISFNSLKQKDEVIDIFIAGREAAEVYFNVMDGIAGPGSPVKKDIELLTYHKEAMQESIECFRRITGKKNDDQHINAQKYLVNTLLKRLQNYKAMNELRKKGVIDEERYKKLLARPIIVKRTICTIF